MPPFQEYLCVGGGGGGGLKPPAPLSGSYTYDSSECYLLSCFEIVSYNYIIKIVII